MEREIIDIKYSDIHQACDHIYSYMQSKCINNIVAIGRGGFLPATILAYKLKVPVFNLGISSYTDHTAGSITETQSPPWNILSNNILIVDDLSDSGQTLHYAKRQAIAHGCSTVYTATCYIKEGTSFIPDIYFKTFSPETWLNFPYE